MQRQEEQEKNFASFSYKEALKQLNLTELLPWKIEVKPIEPSPFFHERMERLQCGAFRFIYCKVVAKDACFN